MLLYSFGLFLYNTAIFCARFFNKKAGLLFNGRQESLKKLAAFKRDPSRKLVWFHCASLGEFEQARPVLEWLRAERDMQIAVSFFSPSGYEIRKNYYQADLVFYLPGDNPSNASMVTEMLKPDLVFFVKYEIWIHYIRAITSAKIPLYLLSATFRPGHRYFKWYGGVFRKALSLFNTIFTQDKASLDLLVQHGFSNVVFSNDTRYDRVYDASVKQDHLPLIEKFKNGETVLVLGSSYEQEEELAAGFLKGSSLKVIIVPHHVDSQRIESIVRRFSKFKTVCYSKAGEADLKQMQVLIIDNIGLLSRIYAYADIAFVGGGFGSKGIHNTLEAAAFGMPVIIGPNNHDRFPETMLMRKKEVLFVVNNEGDFNPLMKRLLADPENLGMIAAKSRRLIKENTGATKVILETAGLL